MSRARSVVHAGVCGFTTSVIAESDDMQSVSFAFDSDCETIRSLAQGFPVVDGYEEIGSGFEGQIHRAVQGALKGCCSGCAVPAGIFKAMQVAAGLALPVPIAIEIERL